MGNYLFSARATLLKALHEDAADPASSHDFGRDILPRTGRRPAGHLRLRFSDQQDSRRTAPTPKLYWRDVGTIDAYWEANMDLRAVKPLLNLYNRQWPLRTSSYPDPPAKFTFDDENRRGEAIDSIVSGGCILSGGRVKNSILGRGVKVHAGRHGGRQRHPRQLRHRPPLQNPPRHSRQERPSVPEDATIGYDLEQDSRLYHVTETGIVVVEGNRSAVDISTVFV